ncbi:MAG: hypothetical protein ABSA83_07045 [Verrucomicrobiota bacterium]|jgi:hypothetical protein
MNILQRSFILGGCVAALTLFTGHHLMAQGRNFDPAQFRQDRLDRAHEQLEFTNNEEWKAIEPLVSKVVDAQRDVFSMRAGGMFGGRGGRRGGGDTANTNGNQPRPRRTPFGEPSPSVTALREAIEAKAPAKDLQAKLAAVRAETKAKEDKLEAAEKDLRDVLTARQEAIAVSNGLIR